jgi:hypothetical protein
MRLSCLLAPAGSLGLESANWVSLQYEATAAWHKETDSAADPVEFLGSLLYATNYDTTYKFIAMLTVLSPSTFQREWKEDV